MIRIYFALLMCIAASSAFGEDLYLIGFELTVSPFDGSDPDGHEVKLRPLPVSSQSRRVLIPACSGRYACDVFIAEIQGSQGKVGISITEYDLPDVPSKIISEVDNTVNFTLGTRETFETRTASTLIELTFLVEPLPEDISDPSVATLVRSMREDWIRAVPYYVDGIVTGARLYPGRDRQGFADLGLMPGDIVVSFDEHRISDVETVKLLQTGMRAETVKNLKIQRDRDLVTVSLN